MKAFCCFCKSRRAKLPSMGYWTFHISKRGQATLPTVMVGCTLFEHGTIRPCFFENKTVTGNSYARMLRHYLMPRLRSYSQSMIFQQDCSLAQFSTVVQITWTINFLEGRWGEIAWLHGRRTLQTWPLLTISYGATSKNSLPWSIRWPTRPENKNSTRIPNIDGLILRKVYRKWKLLKSCNAWTWEPFRAFMG